MKARRKTPPRIPVEEFSVEFGDVNGVPLKEKYLEKKAKGLKISRLCRLIFNP
ncbi:hypothetical protein [Neobacillus sp. LXY-1]|uniref:hypothetical protein n=1 Tax=Neobacillus sp. LXY-1 TaxID=3379133 RepID=UPI003EE04551